LIPAQEASFRKLGLIDRWGVALTVGTILYGLVLVAFYLYPLFLNQYR
jgi:hypothetical protein